MTRKIFDVISYNENTTCILRHLQYIAILAKLNVIPLSIHTYTSLVFISWWNVTSCFYAYYKEERKKAEKRTGIVALIFKRKHGLHSIKKKYIQKKS